MNPLITLFRPIGEKELALIRASAMREFPPRLSWQPIFYPVLNEAYAVEIARDWNSQDEASGHAGFVTRFVVRAEFLPDFEVHVVGASWHQEYWIPAEKLMELNANIVGCAFQSGPSRPSRSSTRTRSQGDRDAPGGAPAPRREIR